MSLGIVRQIRSLRNGSTLAASGSGCWCEFEANSCRRRILGVVRILCLLTRSRSGFKTPSSSYLEYNRETIRSGGRLCCSFWPSYTRRCLINLTFPGVHTHLPNREYVLWIP